MEEEVRLLYVYETYKIIKLLSTVIQLMGLSTVLLVGHYSMNVKN